MDVVEIYTSTHISTIPAANFCASLSLWPMVWPTSVKWWWYCKLENYLFCHFRLYMGISTMIRATTYTAVLFLFVPLCSHCYYCRTV